MVKIISEIGLAHEGSLGYAKELVDESKDAGVDAIKFQIYRTKELIDQSLDPERYERFKKKELKYEDFGELKKYSESLGLEFIATAHTISAFEYLKSLGVATYKVGSGDRGEILKEVVNTGKEVLVSTGMRTYAEIYDLIKDFGGKNMTFLHCVSLYPVATHLANLGFLRVLGRWCKRFDSKMGYSDHMTGALGCELAVAMGAKVIEKHFKGSKSTGQDTLCASDRLEMKLMVKKIRQIETMIKEDLRIYSAEEKENEKWALKGKNGKRPYVF